MSKRLMILLAGVGGFIGGYLPTLFGADSLSGWSLFGGFAGGLLGVWIGYKLSDY